MRMRATFVLSFAISVAGSGVAQFAQPDGGTVRAGTLPLTWETGGPKCMEMPEWQIHEYNADLFILRQSGCTDYEKPFVYVLFGGERALLFDTGSRKGNLAPTLQRLLHQYMVRNKRDQIALTVVHSHAHSDHVAGDAGIQAMSDPAIHVTFVPATVEATKKLYGIAKWPEDVGSIDLGGRVIDAIPIPGHDIVSVALYDRQTGILLTGDSVYPGRIYIRDFAAFALSNARMVRFTEGKPVSHVLGCHIEETSTPFLDYPVGTIYQPHEHALALSRVACCWRCRRRLTGCMGSRRAWLTATFRCGRWGREFRMSSPTREHVRSSTEVSAGTYVGSNAALVNARGVG